MREGGVAGADSVRGWGGVDVGHGELHVGVAGEGAVAGEELVEDDAEGVDVGGRGGAVAEDSFGGQVGGGAEEVAGGDGGVAGGGGDAEVEDLDLAAGGQ
jgi:hypothetical protein